MSTSPKRRGLPPKYPLWTDPLTGERHSLSGNHPHPNYQVCKAFQDRALDPERYYTLGYESDFRLCEAWREDIATFVYELTDEIGFRPSNHDEIKPIDPDLPIGPGNVQWRHPGWRNTRRARFAREHRARRVVELPSGATIPGRVVDALRHKAGCESAHLAPIDCACCSAEVERYEFW